MRLRVLYFVSVYGEGATAMQTQTIIAQHNSGAGDYHAVSGEKEQQPGLFRRLKEAGIPLWVLRGLDRRKDFLRLSQELRRVLAAVQPDVVHVHSNWQLALAAVTRRKAERPFQIVYSMHGYRNHQRFRRLIAKPMIELELAALADHVIQPSLCVWRQFRRVQSKSSIVYQGVDDDFYAGAAIPEFATPKRLVFPGKFRTGKNQDWAIRALRSYIDRTGDAQVRLFLPGEGPLLGRCRKLAASLGLEANVIFPGFLTREAMLELYRTCSYVVVPSRDETFGNCIAEAFTLGRVLFTRRVGVAEEIVKDGVTGFLFESKEDLAEKLVRCLPDLALCRSVSQRCLAANGVFRLTELTELVTAIYQRLASGENAGASGTRQSFAGDSG